ncbi:hypothetical protein [Bradyrhizobium nanningense]|uniref:hypothetical protein n=1 Tax=Bradyrhizobium nanningense TaxID=1325118 RepID=UPI0010092EF1
MELFPPAAIWRDPIDHNRRIGVQLVLVALGRGAVLAIANVRTHAGDDQRALELTGVALVDAK